MSRFCVSCHFTFYLLRLYRLTLLQLFTREEALRIADLFLEGENEFIDIEELFKRFDSKYFRIQFGFLSFRLLLSTYFYHPPNPQLVLNRRGTTICFCWVYLSWV